MLAKLLTHNKLIKIKAMWILEKINLCFFKEEEFNKLRKYIGKHNKDKKN